MRWFVVAISFVPFIAFGPMADAADLAFRPAEEPGFYTFDTGVLRGTFRFNGRSQGMIELIDVASGTPLASGGRLPGLLSPYRVFKKSVRYGNAARDWPTQTKVLDDGALQVFWPSGEINPIEITAVYRWVRPNTLDLELSVTPLRDMPDFELFLSSYFERRFLARVLLKSGTEAETPARFVPADRGPKSQGGYVMFPRDDAAVAMIQDGRWKIPPNPVDWSIEGRLSAPVAMRRDTKTGLTALLMARPEDCFAVSSPFNPSTPTSGGYRSLYLSLFGRDLVASQTETVRTRLSLGKDLSDEKAKRLYKDYLEETK